MTAETDSALSIPPELADAWERIHDGTVEIVPDEDLLAKLVRSRKQNRPLRVKLGADPSAPDLHLGHGVVLRKLRQFQDMGHMVVFIIGDGTGRIGDPTGRSETRPQLSEEEIQRNAQTYFNQVYKILDPDKTEIEFNSRWFFSMKFEDVIRLLSRMTMARMLERDDFEKRHAAGQAIHLHEFMYPLMQGYDSVMVRSDIEVGGTDQKFNLLVGRDLQREAGQEPQCILTMPLLVGLDGEKKMSKSLGNYIGIAEAAEEMYGKAMSIGDELMETYFHLALGYRQAEARQLADSARQGRVHPMELKARLARELTAQFHSQAAAQRAEEHFNRVHRERQRPDEVEARRLAIGPEGAMPVFRLLVEAGLAQSNGEARRLIRGGGFRLGGEAVTDETRTLGRGDYDVQAGKRRFMKITLF